MASTFLWTLVLGVLYLFFMFSTPVKAPAPDKWVSFEERARIAAEEKKAEEEARKAAEAAEKAKTQGPIAVKDMTPEQLVAHGATIYNKTCIACHNKDPNIDGKIGPRMVDAPFEVMEVKVITGRYPDVLPAGFVPKRDTKQMLKFPNLKEDVPAIHAYVQSLKK